jgi:hypothetical protein
LADQLPPVQHSRQPHDSAEWCIERAAADRSAAMAAENDNVRQRYELSAASWTARAEMLQRMADNIRARTEAAHAEWNDEDVPLRAALRAGGEEPSDVRL